MDGAERNTHQNLPAENPRSPERKKPEPIVLFGTFRKKFGFLAKAVLFFALLAAVFSGVELYRTAERNGWLNGGVPLEKASEETETSIAETEPNAETESADVAEPTDPAPADGTAQEAETEAVTAENRSLTEVDEKSLATAVCLTAPADGSPAVLILHTHSAEGYADGAGGVLQVGETLKNALKEKSIAAVHCTATHGQPSLVGCYDRARESIRFFAGQYRELDLVLDLHRSEDADASGKISLTVGTDAQSDGARVSENLSLAAEMMRGLAAEGESVGSVKLVGADLNQDECRHYLTVEIGSVFDTQEEANRLCSVLAKVIASLFADEKSA